MQNGASGASTNGPDGLPANGSWVVQDPIPSHADGWSDVGTTASFEVLEDRDRVDMDDL